MSIGSASVLGPLAVLDRDSWLVLEQHHMDEVDSLTEDHRSRSSEHRTHPVEDFLFTYYSLRPSQLRRWHPGAGIGLADAADRLSWRFHRSVYVADDTVGSESDPSDVRGLFGPATISDATAGSGGTTVAVDVDEFLATRGRSVSFIRDLLSRTATATPQFGCFGLHEWAMLYRAAPDDRRHLDWPLRLGQDGTDQVVADHQIRCSHYDAFRFFTPAARPRNLLVPDLQSRDRMEQPACLHASMDLYKWAYRLLPLISSALLLDCFRLARDIREVDMKASPYDLSALGYPPIMIETPAGKAEYVAAQREFADRGQALRHRLISALDLACGSWTTPDVSAGPEG